MEEAEAAVWKELDDLLKEGVDTAELEKVKNKFETNLMRERANRQKRAATLAFYEMLGDATWSETEVENYRKVTKEHFMQVYKNTVKREKASVLWYMRMDENEG